MRLIALYRPDSLIVGTRGNRGKLALWGAALGAPGMGSVSRYCISHSAVPVIVVRPEAKVKKSQAKREKKDPKRKSYLALLGCVFTPASSLLRLHHLRIYPQNTELTLTLFDLTERAVRTASTSVEANRPEDSHDGPSPTTNFRSSSSPASAP